MILRDTVAIDIALFPPEDVQEKTRAINRELLEKYPEGFLFDQTHWPHVTLLQQFVRRESLEDLTKALDRVLSGIGPIKIQVVKIRKPSSTLHWVIENSWDIQELHDQVVLAAEPWVEVAGDERAFDCSGDEKPRFSDLEWVKNFRRLNSGKNFYPHLTLGVGEIANQQEFFEFMVDTVALCQLGRFCTCRKILYQWNLDVSSEL